MLEKGIIASKDIVLHGFSFLKKSVSFNFFVIKKSSLNKDINVDILIVGDDITCIIILYNLKNNNIIIYKENALMPQVIIILLLRIFPD